MGNCYGLIYGENDPFGAAGIVVPVMNISEITNAILKLVSNPKLIKQMGENGYNRLMYKYRNVYMEENYRRIYRTLGNFSHTDYTKKEFVS